MLPSVKFQKMQRIWRHLWTRHTAKKTALEVCLRIRFRIVLFSSDGGGARESQEVAATVGGQQGVPRSAGLFLVLHLIKCADVQQTSRDKTVACEETSDDLTVSFTHCRLDVSFMFACAADEH